MFREICEFCEPIGLGILKTNRVVSYRFICNFLRWHISVPVFQPQIFFSLTNDTRTFQFFFYSLSFTDATRHFGFDMFARSIGVRASYSTQWLLNPDVPSNSSVQSSRSGRRRLKPGGLTGYGSGYVINPTWWPKLLRDNASSNNLLRSIGDCRVKPALYPNLVQLFAYTGHVLSFGPGLWMSYTQPELDRTARAIFDQVIVRHQDLASLGSPAAISFDLSNR